MDEFTLARAATRLRRVRCPARRGAPRPVTTASTHPALLLRSPPGFVREVGRQMFATSGTRLLAPRAEMLVRTGTTCGSRPPGGAGGNSGSRSSSVQAIMNRLGCGCAGLSRTVHLIKDMQSTRDRQQLRGA